MGLDSYLRRDVENILRATACASEGSAGLAIELMGDSAQADEEAEKLLQMYLMGVRHALVSMGLAFGLEPVGPGVKTRPGVSPEIAGLLWAEVPKEY